MAAADAERTLEVLLLLALRITPSLLWLARPLQSPALALALGLGASIALCPLALRITPGPQLSAASAGLELGRGVTLGLGTLLPLLALGWAGRISDAIRDARPLDPHRTLLERLYLAAALAVLFASGAHTLVWRALATGLGEVPLGSSSGELPAIGTIALELAKLLARAFELGVVLAAPVVLVCATAALLLGFTSRAAPRLGAALLRGPLLPVLGLSAACLSISSILGRYPEAAGVFLEATRALFSTLR